MILSLDVPTSICSLNGTVKLELPRKSSRSDDDPANRSSTEHYSRVAADLDWSILLGSTPIMIYIFII
jgi:hypothetical protein